MLEKGKEFSYFEKGGKEFSYFEKGKEYIFSS